MASTTKIMTALLICEQCNVLDRMRIPKEAVGIEGSSMYLQEGEVLTLQELLYGLMLSSGQRCRRGPGHLLRRHGGGLCGADERQGPDPGLEGHSFCQSQRPGCPGPLFPAPQIWPALGLMPWRIPIFAKTVSTKTVQAGGRALRNHNKLLWLLPGAEGIKTGFTKAAGRILVSSAQRQGRRLVAATMDAPDDWRDHQALLEAGFADFRIVPIISAGEQLGMRTILGGAGKVRLVAGEDFSFALAQGEQPQIVIGGQNFAYAPVAQGAEAGTAYVLLSGKIVGRVPLVYGETVEQLPPEKKSPWQRLFGK